MFLFLFSLPPSSSPFSLSSIPPASAQLLWDDGEEEELDYDESMEDLDLHPTGTIDDLEGAGVGGHRLSVTSLDPKPGRISLLCLYYHSVHL